MQLESRSVSVEIVETYSEPCEISKMVLFAKIARGIHSLTTFAKSSSFNVWQSSEYACE